MEVWRCGSVEGQGRGIRGMLQGPKRYDHTYHNMQWTGEKPLSRAPVVSFRTSVPRARSTALVAVSAAVSAAVLDDGASAAGAAMAAATSSAQAAMEPCIAASGSTGWMMRPRTALANIAACSPAPLATYDTSSSVRREEMGLEKRRRWHLSMILGTWG